MNEELAYIIFIMGYETYLHDYFANRENNECDVVFDECKKIAMEYLHSEEYKNDKMSVYESFWNWFDKYYYLYDGETLVKAG